jgi:putative MATE family efflux protein
MKKLLSYGLPAIIENILTASVAFVDGFLVAKISTNAVAGVGLANGILALYQAIFIALSVAVTTRVAYARGKGETTQNAIASGLKLTLAIGGIMGVLTVALAGPILALLGARGGVLIQGQGFLMIVGGTILLMGLSLVLSAILRAYGQTKTPLYVSLVVNILNIAIDAYLIFGLKWGVFGTALGTTIARLVGVGLLLYLIRQASITLTIKGKSPGFINLALPIVGERLMMRLGDLVIFAIVIHLGAQVFAGNSIGETMTSYNYLFAFGFATAISVLVSHQVGAGNINATQTTLKQGWGLSFVSGFLLSAGTCLAFSKMITWFTPDHVVAKAAWIVVLVSMLCQPFVSGVLTYTAALQAMGDSKTPMLATTIGMWVFRLGLSALLGLLTPLGLWGVWIGTAVDNAFRLGVLKWTYTKKVEKLRLP